MIWNAIKFVSRPYSVGNSACPIYSRVCCVCVCMVKIWAWWMNMIQQMSKSRCAPQLRYENRTCEVKAADAFLKRTCDLHFAGAILITQLRDFKTHLRSSLRRCDFHNADVISKRICDLHFAGAIFITQVGFQDASATFTSQVGLSYRRCDFKTQVQRF